MGKNFVKISLGGIVLIAAAVSAFCLSAQQRHPAGLSGAKQNAAIADSGEKPAVMGEKIHGQIVYDARAALPPQAALNIKLMENDPDRPQISAIIAEIHRPLSGRSPLDWVLPLRLSSLNRQKSYKLQAKISNGDLLLFVNAEAQPVDTARSAYSIKLEKVESGAANAGSGSNLIGQTWLAESLSGRALAQHSEINLNFDENAKTDPATGEKRYSISGFGGCNRYMGSAALDESKQSIEFSPLATGFIACAPDIARQEADFLNSIGKTRFYRLDESGILTLLDEGQNPLARFAAR